MEEKTQTYIRVQDVQKRYGWRKILKGASNAGGSAGRDSE